MSKQLAVVALAVALSAPAFASVTWRGDFETGDRSQYSSTQMMSEDRLQVVTSPVRDGRYALRAEVRQGDDPINASGNRNELVKHDGAREGTEFYYGWSTLWPEDYPLTPTWQVFMQWHHSGNSGAPPVRFVLGCSANDCGSPMPDTLFLIVDGKTVWTKTGIKLGDWTDFVLHVKWSANPSVGFVELWYDGELVLPKTYRRTMFSSGDTNYLKMGLYRAEETQPTAVLYHDELVQATTYEEAAPRTVVVDPEPTPEPTDPTDPTEPTEPTDPTDPTNPGNPPSVTGPTSPAPVFPPTSSGATPVIPQGAGCSQAGGSLATWALALGVLALLPLVRRRRAAVPVATRHTRR